LLEHPRSQRLKGSVIERTPETVEAITVRTEPPGCYLLAQVFVIVDPIREKPIDGEHIRFEFTLRVQCPRCLVRETTDIRLQRRI
jgi:hypothetical protein